MICLLLRKEHTLTSCVWKSEVSNGDVDWGHGVGVTYPIWNDTQECSFETYIVNVTDLTGWRVKVMNRYLQVGCKTYGEGIDFNIPT